MTRTILALLLLVGSPLVATADENPAGAEEAPVPEARVFTTQHEMKLGGKTISYTATAGTLLMKNDNGEPAALIQ